MEDSKYTNENLIKLQHYAWYIALVYFGATVILFVTKSSLAETLAFYGLIYVIAVTILKLFVMAQRFRELKVTRLWVLCYLLVVILISVVILRYFL